MKLRHSVCLFDITPGGIFVLMPHIFLFVIFACQMFFLSLSSERKEEKDRVKHRKGKTRH